MDTLAAWAAIVLPGLGSLWYLATRLARLDEGIKALSKTSEAHTAKLETLTELAFQNKAKTRRR